MIWKQFSTFAIALAATVNVCCTGAIAQGSVNRPVTDKWAVVVGISKFADKDLNLRYPSKDAQDFYDYLITKGHFAKDHVKLLLDEKATRDRIRDVLGDSWLPRAALPDDLVVIFISSHGSSSELDIGGVNYIVAHDTNPNKLYTTGIPMSQLASIIKDRVHSDRVLLVLDTCHAGGARSESKGIVRQGNADAQALAQGTGQLVICSSDTNQVSWEGKTYPNSVFTRTLIDSLEKQSDGSVTKVFDQVKEKVVEQVVQERGVMQTPVLEASKWSGNELVLSCVPSKPRQAMREIVEEDYSPQETIPDASASATSGKTTVASASTSATTTSAARPVVIATAPAVKPVVKTPVSKPVSTNTGSTSPLSTNPVSTNTAGVANVGSVSSAQPAAGAVPPGANLRMERESNPIDFLRYHFKLVEEKRFSDAWADLGQNYRAKFKDNQAAYTASVSRHKWLSYYAPNSEFRVLPKSGTSLRVRVRMNTLTGFNGVWVYEISVHNGVYAIEDVSVSSQPLNSD